MLRACRDWFLTTGRRISFEYTLIAGKNDSRENAAALARQLGAAKAELCSPAPSGNSFVALDRSIPRDTVWNIAFD